jgi:hypothetical protein
MQRFANRRRIYLLGALLASQWLSACVVVPVPYHRHRPYISEPGYGGGSQAPGDQRDYRGRRDRGPY